MDITQLMNKTIGRLDKKKKIFLLALAGILLICASYFENISSKSETDSENKVAENSVSTYKSQMEKQVRDTIENIKGISNVDVLITLKSNGEKILQYDSENTNSDRSESNVNENSSSTKKTTVILQNDGGENPYIVKEMYPEVEGIAVAAKGIEASDKKDSVINMLSALFDVPVHKISIIEKD